MVDNALQDLIGTTVLHDFRLDALVRTDDALAAYTATCTADGSACTVRISRILEVNDHQEASMHAALTRIGRHAVGIRGLAPPRAAGVVKLEGQRRLAVAHGGQPTPCAADRIEAGQTASIDEVLDLLGPLGEALGALHDQGIVHGAIHTAAVRFDPAGTTLSGFGLSELASVLGGPAAARDVIPVRSRTPEQVGIIPASPSPESDTYALAMVAVELLAGRTFTDERQRPTPRSLGVKIDDRVDEVFAEALRAEPRSRTSDPRRFLQALSESRWAAEQPQAEGAKADAPSSSKPPVCPEPPSGFEPPPRPRPPRLRPSSFYPPPPPAPDKTKSSTWFVYSLVGLGFLLLVGGVGAMFVHVLRSPATSRPIATVSTAPSPLPGMPPALPGPRAADAGSPNAAPDALESVPPPVARGWVLPDGGPAVYPQDADALIPIDADTSVIGSRDALVTIVVFADMQCPHTRRARVALERLLSQFGSELRVTVRHLPLSGHPDADLAAEIAAGSYALGGAQPFWTVFEKMTDNQSHHTRDRLLDWAADAGVPRSKLATSLDTHAYRPAVQQDIQLAGQLMVRATPTFFVNGWRFDGMQSQSTLVSAVQSERRAARAALGSGTPASTLYKTRVHFNITSAAADQRLPHGP